MNPYRGEIEAEIDGKTRLLCLTLGALAELEHTLGLTDLNRLLERFAAGTFQARDLIAIIGAGLRGAGASCTNDDVAQMHTKDGLIGFARIAARLLEATFLPPASKEEPTS